LEKRTPGFAPRYFANEVVPHLGAPTIAHQAGRASGSGLVSVAEYIAVCSHGEVCDRIGNYPDNCDATTLLADRPLSPGNRGELGEKLIDGRHDHARHEKQHDRQHGFRVDEIGLYNQSCNARMTNGCRHRQGVA